MSRLREQHPPTGLPEARTRLRLGQKEESIEISLRLEFTTPILGGAAQTRILDEIDIVRPGTIRGHLRFWWRALARDRQDLHKTEGALWGAIHGEGDEAVQRSAVQVRVDVESVGRPDTTDIQLYPKRDVPMTPGAYALWPARRTTTGEPLAPRREPGTRFRLTLVVPKGHLKEVEDALRAWILFGGYGSRTRRGVGSLTVLGQRTELERWLPASASAQALFKLFGRDLFAPESRPNPTDTPSLAGAALLTGRPGEDAVKAWTEALGWLSQFRQGQGFARDIGSGTRPGQSLWPEADKVRQLDGNRFSHRARHNDKPVWPRASFGLPIVTQFNGGNEPDNFEINWLPDGAKENDDVTGRLASPLILKAMPLANGRFAPVALWLFRGFPKGKAGIVRRKKWRKNSGADFDVLIAPSDTALFGPLNIPGNIPTSMRVRYAFLSWVQGRAQLNEIAPILPPLEANR